jgi:hypothetical protein
MPTRRPLPDAGPARYKPAPDFYVLRSNGDAGGWPALSRSAASWHWPFSKAIRPARNCIQESALRSLRVSRRRLSGRRGVYNPPGREVLFVFLVLEHRRRRVLHFNVTEQNPYVERPIGSTRLPEPFHHLQRAASETNPEFLFHLLPRIADSFRTRQAMSACSAGLECRNDRPDSAPPAACITVTNARQRNAMPADAFLANDSLANLRVRVLRTPLRAPKANSVCERLGGSLRRKCLDF